MEMEKEKKQKTIGEMNSPEASEDSNMGKKKLDAEGIMTFLDGMGFEQDNGKQGLYKKILDNTEPTATAFWDFRSTPKGKFYVGNMGGGFWKDDEAKQLSEYIEVRKVIGDEDKSERKQSRSVQQKQTVPETTGAIVVRDENQAHDIMNLKDDAQILAEMEGKYLDEFVYSFDVEGGKRKVTGLSWAGVKEVVRSAGGIEIEDIKITETDKSFRVLAKGRDTIRAISLYGIAEQPKKMKLKSGEFIEDAHALSKCVSRAQRNALRVLIPEATIKMTIEKYLSEKKKSSSS